ncbi:MAG: YggL family protein [Parabacteroides sp.]|nr:YggL family protein [Parabacteroides sp.]
MPHLVGDYYRKTILIRKSLICNGLLLWDRKASMNKRRRKKLRKGEFKELGCSLKISLAQTLDQVGLDVWWGDFIETIERLGLSVGGGGHYDLVFGVSSATKRGSMTIQQQEQLAAWLSENPMVEKYQMSGLFDKWYPPKHILADL